MVGIYPGVHLGDYIPKGYSLDFLTSASIGFAVHHLEQEQTILNLRVGGGERVDRLGMTQQVIKCLQGTCQLWDRHLSKIKVLPEGRRTEKFTLVAT